MNTDYKCVTTVDGIWDYIGGSGIVAFDFETAPNDANPGYSVFDVNGVNIYTPKTTAPAPAVPFLVKVSITDLNISKGPGTDYARIQYIPVGIYTIVEGKSGKGSTAGWGQLKSGVGWISLDLVKRV